MSKKNCCDKKYPSHEKELPRLNKIVGQMEGIRKMIEEERYCVEILQQLSAAKSAVNSLQANILETHLLGCVKETFKSNKKKDIEAKIEELKTIFVRY